MRLIALLLVTLVVLPSLGACDRQKPEAPQAPAAEAGPVKGADRSHKGEEAPTATFAGPDGGTTDIASFAGRPVLVNLWATWCGPCVKELPTLQVMATEESAGQPVVIAISQDDGDQATVDAFLGAKKIGRFAAFHDPAMGVMSALGVQVLPTTILYDAAGKEVWRYTGDLDWTSGEARALVAEAAKIPRSS